MPRSIESETSINPEEATEAQRLIQAKLEELEGTGPENIERATETVGSDIMRTLANASGDHQDFSTTLEIKHPTEYHSAYTDYQASTNEIIETTWFESEVPFKTNMEVLGPEAWVKFGLRICQEMEQPDRHRTDSED